MRPYNLLASVGACCALLATPHARSAEPNPATSPPAATDAPEAVPSVVTAPAKAPAAERVAPETKVLPTAGYRPGGFFIRSEDGRFDLTIGGWAQTLLTFDSDEAADLSRDNRVKFSIPRARLQLRGKLYDGLLQVFAQFGFGGGVPKLVDFWVDWRAIPDTLYLRVGQFRRPWSRENLGPGFATAMVDFPRTGGAFRAGRDMGLMLHNNYRKSPEFEWALGVFNGTSIATRLQGAKADPDTLEVSGGQFLNVPTSFKPAMFLRLGYNYGGIKGYQFSDLDKGDFRWALGFGAMVMLDTEVADASLIAGQVDLLVQYQGLTISGAGYVTSDQTGGSFGDRDWERAGFHVHAGYLIGPSDWVARPEPVARYTQIAERGGVDTKEATFGINVFFFGYQLRWATEASLRYAFPRLDADGPDTLDYQVRTQLTVRL